jgi:hypothetical protein
MGIDTGLNSLDGLDPIAVPETAETVARLLVGLCQLVSTKAGGQWFPSFQVSAYGFTIR